VVPKKTIVCKVLRISGNQVELSLRRVKEKEKKEVMEQYKLERSYASILKTILKDKTKGIIEKIKETQRLYNFIEEIKEDSSNLEKLVGKVYASKILEILKTQKQKKIILKKEIHLTTTQPNGLNLIKEILGKITEVEVKYISGGTYSLKTEDENIKKADTKLKEIIEKIEAEAKEKGFEIKQK
ncbi:hypothetical protein HOG16_01385, partial [Candidatus Woesearchaeota archaeon]|nr:hypothetical protein [Candidatus Woesearchaeota archaeon]